MPPTTEFIRLSAAQESRLQRQVIQHRDEAIIARGDFPIRHSDRYRRYLADPSMRPPGPWPDAPRLFVPITRSILERLHGEVWQALFANLGQVSMQPFGEEDLENADIATKFLRWTLTKVIPWQHISSMLIFDALLDSVGVAKVMSWTPPWDAPSTRAGRSKQRFLSRTVRIDPLDLGMLLVAPDAEGLQYPECRYVAQEFFLREDDILRMADAGFDVPTHTDQLGYAQQMTDRKRLELEREGQNVVEFRPDSIPFVESYERFAIDKYEEDVIVSWFPDAQVSGESSASMGRIAGVRRLIDVFPQDDRPRRPFFDISIWAQPRQWRGLNVPDRLETMQDLINRLHEQLVNYGDVSILPYVFANTFLTGELPDLRSVRPGSTVPIDDINGVQFAPTRSLNRHFMEQISLAMSNIERDTNVTDFNLGRQPDRPNAPRTASATLAILGESRKSYSMLVRHNANQFADLLTFAFRLWQEILPPNTYAQVGEPNFAQGVDLVELPGEEPAASLFSRLFEDTPRLATGNPRLLAIPIAKEQLSGFFDVTLEVNPEEAFDRQVMLSLFQLAAPFIQAYPLGSQKMLKRIWGSFDQHGFDDIYPEWFAAMQTQQTLLAAQVQLATLQGQLDQLQQLQLQQDLQQQLAVQQATNPQQQGVGAPLGTPPGSELSPQALAGLAAMLGANGAPSANGAQ